MPPLLGLARVREFQTAFGGELNSLAGIYREATGDMLQVLADASATLAARRRATEHIRQYQRALAEMRDEAAAWIEVNIPRAYNIGLEFADEGIANMRQAGVNVRRRQYQVFAQVHVEAVQAISVEMQRTMDFAAAKIGRRVGDEFRRVGMEEVARGAAEGLTRVDVSRAIERRLVSEVGPFFEDAAGRKWRLDNYSEMVARTTTRETMTQGTINRLKEHRIQLAQVSAHVADDFCIYYENVIVCLYGEHPDYPDISAIEGGPPFHPRCVHVLTPFVEALADPEELRAGIMGEGVAEASPAQLQARFRREFPERARQARQRGMRTIRARGRGRTEVARPAAPPPAPKPPWEKAVTNRKAMDASGWTDEFRNARDNQLWRGINPMHVGQSATRQHEKDIIARGLGDGLRNNASFQELATTMEQQGLLSGQFARYDNEITNAASRLVEQWSWTSGDADSLSIALQKAAAAEFKVAEKSSMWWSKSAVTNAEQLWLQKHETGLRSFARAMYDQTQEWLKEAGITKMTVARGVYWEGATEVPVGLQWGEAAKAMGQRAQINLQPMSSFSTDLSEAVGFAQGGSHHVVMVVDVPAERIIGTARTGFGCLHEAEVVILNGGAEEMRVITWTQEHWTMGGKYNEVLGALAATP